MERSVAIHDATPVGQAIRDHGEALTRVRALGNRHAEAFVTVQLGRLHGMSGDYDKARELIAAGGAIFEDMGLEVSAAMGPAEQLGYVAMLLGDLETAEEALRRGYDELERLGEKGYLSTLAGALARVLYDRGHYEDAERFSEVSEGAASRDDVWSQALWRGARAKVLARRGDFDRAESLAREAVALLVDTDIVSMRADAFVDLGEILHLRDRADEARNAVKEALGLYEQKGIVPAAEQTRARLVELSPDHAAAS
jgi:tetratricopeptide (TPR) repeat protein